MDENIGRYPYDSGNLHMFLDGFPGDSCPSSQDGEEVKSKKPQVSGMQRAAIGTGHGIWKTPRSCGVFVQDSDVVSVMFFFFLCGALTLCSQVFVLCHDVMKRSTNVGLDSALMSGTLCWVLVNSNSLSVIFHPKFSKLPSSSARCWSMAWTMWPPWWRTNWPSWWPEVLGLCQKRTSPELGISLMYNSTTIRKKTNIYI